MVFFQVIQFPSTVCVEYSDRIAEEFHILFEVFFLFLLIVQIALGGVLPPRQKNEIVELVSPFFSILVSKIGNH